MVRFICICISSIIIAGCAGGSLKPTVPSNKDARRACPTDMGTIIDLTDVTIEGATEIAQGTGAAFGAYVGNRAAQNESEVTEAIATGVAAVAGSMAGDLAGKTVLSRAGVELMVLIPSRGSTYSIIQESDINQPFEIGQDVWVLGNLQGAPDNNNMWNSRYGKQTNTGCQSGVRVLIKR